MSKKNRVEKREDRCPVLVIGEIGLLSSVGELDIPVYIGSETTQNIALHSRFAKQSFIFSDYDTSSFINELCELGQRFEKKPVIFSDDDRALLNISQHRERLKDHYQFLYPEKQTVNKLLDKQSFVELSEEYDLPSPGSFQVASLKEFHSISSQISYPCIIKPTQRHFWWGEEFIDKVGFYRKAIKCSDYDELCDIYQKISEINPSVVIQEYVEGDDKQHYSANLLIDKEGALQGYYIAQKKRIYPIKAGSGTYVETVKNPDVLDISMSIINKLGLKGLVNVQFKQDCRTGKYKLMEIHIRNSMWSLLGTKAGANLAHMYYRHLVNGYQVEEPVEARPHVKYFDLTKDFLAFRSYQAEGTLTFREWWNSLKGDRVFAILSSRDLMPLIFQIWYFTMTKMKLSRNGNPKKDKEKWFNTFVRRYINPLTKIF